MSVIEKPYIFITGAPRSGTSMLTKIIDSHPDVGIFMENIFGLRRRHWNIPEYWGNDDMLFKMVLGAYTKLEEPVVGNKVCVPDVWNTDEILKMCSLFQSSKILFVVRDPVDVIFSRLRREAPDHYTDEAIKYLCLDWRDKYYTYISSWRQSVEVYWKLKDMFQERIMLVYYDDFICDVDSSISDLFNFIGLMVHKNVLDWYKLPHHDSEGKLVSNLKYKDEPVRKIKTVGELPADVNKYLTSLPHHKLWLDRAI